METVPGGKCYSFDERDGKLEPATTAYDVSPIYVCRKTGMQKTAEWLASVKEGESCPPS